MLSTSASATRLRRTPPAMRGRDGLAWQDVIQSSVADSHSASPDAGQMLCASGILADNRDGRHNNGSRGQEG